MKTWSILIGIVVSLSGCKFESPSTHTGNPPNSLAGFPGTPTNDQHFSAQNSRSESTDGGTIHEGSSGGGVDGGKREGLYHESFLFGGRKIPTDFLLVLDNSVSMTSGRPSYKDRTREGLLALPDDLFPEGSQLGVMTTMTGKYTDLSSTHAGIYRYQGINLEPGFLSLVNEASIEKFLNQQPPPKFLNSYPKTACDSGWFSPKATGDRGQNCLEAALQNPNFGVGCEAGLNAFDQLLTKYQGNSFFRPGAFVQVILISDEVHPGCTNQELIDRCPKLDALNEKLKRDNSISGITFNGIINPKETAKCPLIPIIEATGGTYLDITTATDYRPVFRDIAGAKPEKAVVALKYPARALRQVVVSGIRVAATLSDDGKTVTIEAINTSQINEIDITYELAALD